MSVLRQATRTRLILAKDFSAFLEHDPKILAVVATGSIARNRCSSTSDLDLTVITRDSGRRRSITSEVREGVHMDIEWLTRRRAWAILKGGKRDLKGLRESSRLGLGIFLFDRDQLETTFRTLAVNLLPDKDLIEQRMAVVWLSLKKLASRRLKRKGEQWELLRSFVDNVVFVLLMLHPIRYHKPKWVMADLREAGYPSLNALLRRAYRIGSDSSNAARRSLDLSKQFIDGMGNLMNAPDLGDMLKKGFTRKYAAWSYVCRTWEDAESLYQDRAFIESDFTAKFAVRMTFPLYLERSKWNFPRTDPLFILQKIKDARLFTIYRRLFPIPNRQPQPNQKILEECLDWSKACWTLIQQAYAGCCPE